MVIHRYLFIHTNFQIIKALAIYSIRESDQTLQEIFVILTRCDFPEDYALFLDSSAAGD